MPTPAMNQFLPLSQETGRRLSPRIPVTCLLCFGAVMALGWTVPVLGAEEESPWEIGIALGQGQRSNPLINSEDIGINAVVDLSWYGKRFFFDNGDVGFLLHETSNTAFNLIATYNNERNYYNYLTGKDLGLNILSSLGGDFRFTSVAEDAQADSSLILVDDSGEILSPAPPPLAGTKEPDLAQALADTELPGRDYAVNGGLEFLHISRWGDIQAQLLTDISGTHDGQEAWLSWTYPWFTKTNEFSFTAGLEWKSGDLISYYYGVRPGEAFPGRPAYETGSGTNAYVRFSASHAFSRHWKLVSVMEREALSSAITNSPIVKNDHVNTWFMGLFYRF